MPLPRPWADTDREEVPVRHPGDVVRVVLGLSIFLGTAVAVRRRHLGRFETDVFRIVNDLPGALDGLLRSLMQAGSAVAISVSAALALLARRPRMARDLGVAGLAAWGGAKLAKSIVGRGRPLELLHGVVVRGQPTIGFGFPAGHVAVAAALATAAAPYLGRVGRRLVWAWVVIVAIARMYVGAHLPVDTIGGAALGWTIGSLVHLAFGAPDGQPSAAMVRGG